MANAAGQKKIKDTQRKAAVIRKSVAGISKGFSRGAERVADIIIDEGQALKGQKAKLVKDETIQMFKGVSRQLKSDLGDVKAGDFISVAAYSAGKVSAVIGRGFRTILE